MKREYTHTYAKRNYGRFTKPVRERSRSITHPHGRIHRYVFGEEHPYRESVTKQLKASIARAGKTRYDREGKGHIYGGHDFKKASIYGKGLKPSLTYQNKGFGRYSITKYYNRNKK